MNGLSWDEKDGGGVQIRNNVAVANYYALMFV